MSREARLLALLPKLDGRSVNKVIRLLQRDTVNLNHVDKDSSYTFLHGLAQLRPSQEQVMVAREICTLLTRQGSQQQLLSENASCLYGKSKAGNDPVNLAARSWTLCKDEEDLLVEFVDALLGADDSLLKRYASDERLAQTELLESTIVGGSKKLLEHLAQRFGLKSGEALAGVRTSGGCSLPQVATAKGHMHLLEWLSEPGTWHAVPLDVEDNDGETALFDAAAYGRKGALRYLLDEGSCEIDHRSRLGDTALFRALKNDHFAAAEILLTHGANARLKDFGRNCVLHAALQMPENKRKQEKRRQREQADNKSMEKTVARYLDILSRLNVEYKVAMSTENLAGYNPLHACVEAKNWLGLTAAMQLHDIDDSTANDSALLNSNGVNVLHVFFCFHSEPADVARLMAILGNRRWKRMLRARAVKGKSQGGGDRAGYNCLHFACEFNNSAGVDYLVKDAGFSLADRTATGKSAADLLLHHRRCSELRSIHCLETEERKNKPNAALRDLRLCSLVDPVRMASVTQQSGTAQRLAKKMLCLCWDERERSELLRFPTTSLSSFKSGRLSLARGGKDSLEIPLGVRLLLRCINDDDCEGVQRLTSLGLLDNLWHPEFIDDARKFWDKEKERLQSVGESPPVDLIEFCLVHHRHNVCLELLRCRQFDLLPACLRFIIYCNNSANASQDAGQQETLQKQRDAAKNILLNSLGCLDDRVSEGSAQLVEKYIEGRIDGGPRYRQFSNGEEEFSVAELLDKSGVDEALATSCIRRLVYNSWWSHDASSCTAPGVKFILHILTYLIFTVCLTIFITMGDTCYSLRTTGGLVIYIILAQFSLDLIFMHAVSLASDSSICGDRWRRFRWIVGLIGPLFLLVGLVGVPVVEFSPGLENSISAQYGVLMCLATAYVFLAVRWLKFFKWIQFCGPTVGIIEQLLVQDLLPFLLIFLIFILAFGVFFQALLYPGRRTFDFMSGTVRNMSVCDVIVGIYARPLMLTFGEIEIESLRRCMESHNCSDLKDTDCTCPYSEGTRLYLAVFAFIFLILSVALLNLLIAKFSLTVNTSTERAFVTWNSYRFRLMKQFQQLPSVPPPYSWLSWVCCGCSCGRPNNRIKGSASTDVSWWHKQGATDALPENYRDFLWFQSQKFRSKRAGFLQPVVFPAADMLVGEEQLHASWKCWRLDPSKDNTEANEALA